MGHGRDKLLRCLVDFIPKISYYIIMKYFHITVAFTIAPFVGIYLGFCEFLRVCMVIPNAVINEYAKEEKKERQKS